MGLAKYYEDNLEAMNGRWKHGDFMIEPYRRAAPGASPKIRTAVLRTRSDRSKNAKKNAAYYAREAERRGISYGQLVAMINAGMELPPVIREK